MEAFTWLSSYFWDSTSSFWLPPGYAWKDLQPYKTTSVNWIWIGSNSWLLHLVLLAVLLVILKLFFERFIFVKLGQGLGVSGKQCSPPPSNFILESCYEANHGRSPTRPEDFERLTHLTGMNRRALEQWHTQRTLSALPTNLTKFAQSLWIGVCHLLVFSLGVGILWSKSWLWNVDNCWTNYPHQEITEDIQLFYFIGAGVYISLFQGAQRQEFWPEVVGDVARLALLVLSWYSNLCRVGALILFVHDSANVPLYFIKTAFYAEKRLTLLILGPLFLIVWVFARLLYIPFFIIKSIILEAPEHFEPFPAFSLITFLVNVLSCLDIYWTWQLFQVLRKHYYPATPVQNPSTVDSTPNSSVSSAESNSRTDVDEEAGKSDDSMGTLKADSTTTSDSDESTSESDGSTGW